MRQIVFTIGHSTHSIDGFISLLKGHGINAICDVRSKPYSRMNPQFNREDFKDSLRAATISYVFLGKELGARSDDTACYEADKVQYDRLAATELFRKGIERVRHGAPRYRIALMCAEKEPLECHRTILVSRHLHSAGLIIQHIHADGRLESHEDALKRLIHVLHLPEHDMFRSHEDIVADAYRLQGNLIAYTRNELELPNSRRLAG
jgi:uncharacterized protein (DUF488 family)